MYIKRKTQFRLSTFIFVIIIRSFENILYIYIYLCIHVLVHYYNTTNFNPYLYTLYIFFLNIPIIIGAKIQKSYINCNYLKNKI